VQQSGVAQAHETPDQQITTGLVSKWFILCFLVPLKIQDWTEKRVTGDVSNPICCQHLDTRRRMISALNL